MIVANLRASRENMFLKQKDISKIFGNNPSTISGWETGKDTIPLEKLVYYANYYKFNLDYLFGLENKNNYIGPIVINKKNIGSNLKQYRKNTGLTQVQVAALINISQGTYSDYESGTKLIKTIPLYSLSTIYKDFSFYKIFDLKR